MPTLDQIASALSQPLRTLFDPEERVYWAYLLGALAMPLFVLGLRQGLAALRTGLLRRELWTHPSSRAEITLIFAKAIVAAVLGVPWVAATASAALGVGLALHDILGPVTPSTWSPWTIRVVYAVVLFVGWDLSRFVLHLAMHRVRWLWTFHQVHHSAEVLTPLTLYRTHPFETLLYDLRGLVSTAAITGTFLYLFPGRLHALEILGINAFGFLFNAAGANLRHSHVWLRFGRLERWLLSPAQHQIHHGREFHEQNSNLGVWLSIWDRLAGTWVPAGHTPPRAYGLDDANHRPDAATSMLAGPLRELVTLAMPRHAAAAATVGLVVCARTSNAAEPAPRGVPESSAVPWTDADTEAEVEVAPPSEPPATPPAAADSPPTPSAETPAPSEPELPTEGAPESDVRTVVVGSMFDDNTIPRVAGSAHVVDERELERREYDDIHRVLSNNVPGVYVRGEDGFGLRPNIGMRGANPDRSAKVTLMEDGVLMGPAPYSAPAAYYFPLATRMTAVEVFKGPASIRYGPNTIGGAINLRTRDIPDRHTSVVDLAGGRFGYMKGHAFYGTTYRGFGVLVEAARVQSTGFKELDGGGDTGFAKNDTMLKLSYTTREDAPSRHRIEAKLGYGSEDSDETYLGLTREDFDATPYRRYAASARDNMTWWRSQAQLGYTMKHGEAIELDVRAYRHDYSRLWRRLDSMRGGPPLTDLLANPNAGQAAVFAAVLRGEQDSVLPQQALLVAGNARRFVSEGVQTAFRWRPRWKNVEQDLEIGARLHHDGITRHHTSEAFLMQSGVMVPEGTPIEDTTRNRGESIAGSVHVFDSLTLWKRLTIAPGVRVELVQVRFADTLADERTRRFDVAVTPGIGALVNATPWLAAFAGVHRGYSPVLPGQPAAVKPEYAINYEAGLRALYKGLFVEAVGFASDYSNMTGVCTFSSGCIDGDGSDQYDAGEALVWGTELLARWRHRFDRGTRLEIGARYTYTGSRFRNDFESAFPQWGAVEAGYRLPYVPQHIAGGTLAVGGRIWEISAAPSYTGAMRDIAGEGDIPEAQRIDGFFVLDLSAEVRVLRRFRLYTQIANATNNAYIASLRPFGARPGAPLTFVLGVKATIM